MGTNNKDGGNPVILSELARRRLESAGWFPGRRVNIEGYVSVLEAVGFSVFPVVRNFLAEFGGIRVRHQYGELEFDPSWQADILHPDNIEMYIRVLDMPICVIGVWRGITLCMDSEGKVYGGFGPALYFCGATSSEAIENMLMRNDIQLLYEEDLQF